MSLLRRRLMMQIMSSAQAHPEIEHYNAGDILLSIDYRDRKLIKYNDGFCISGAFNSGSWTCPVVIGLTTESVLYGYSDRGAPATGNVSSSVKTLTYNGTEYKVVLNVFSALGASTPTFFNNKEYSRTEVNKLLPAIDFLNYYYYGVI